MYRILIFSALIAASLGEKRINIDELPAETKELMKTLRETCVKEVGVDVKLIDKAGDGDFVEDEKLMCYSKCLMKESGVMDDNGEIQIDVFADLIPENIREHVKKTMTTCISQATEDDQCEKAFSFMKCYHIQDPENFIMI